MAVKVSQNLDSMEKLSAQRNQQLSRYVFLKIIERLEKSNTRVNKKHSRTKTSTSITKHINREQNIRIKVWRYKAVEYLKI